MRKEYIENVYVLTENIYHQSLHSPSLLNLPQSSSFPHHTLSQQQLSDLIFNSQSLFYLTSFYFTNLTTLSTQNILQVASKAPLKCNFIYLVTAYYQPFVGSPSSSRPISTAGSHGSDSRPLPFYIYTYSLGNLT